MNSRDQILKAVRSATMESIALPELSGPWIEYPDPWQQFTSVQEMIGGRCIRVPDAESAHRELQSLPQFAAARRVISTIENIGPQTEKLNEIADPHTLSDVDLAILPGEFGVAENAAIWVNDAQLKHRVIYFLAHHLVLVLRADAIVHNMSLAYERLAFQEARFGAFIAGPSKTADIEQSLVIGAHGPKSLTVFVVGSEK